MNEADIQVLASIRRAEVEGESSDRVTLESSADRYWKYLEDWSDSWRRLLDEGLIQGDKGGYSLTERGRIPAEHYYAERPDHFWYYYQHYYPAAQASCDDICASSMSDHRLSLLQRCGEPMGTGHINSA
jgi:hypothetical protein